MIYSVWIIKKLYRAQRDINCLRTQNSFVLHIERERCSHNLFINIVSRLYGAPRNLVANCMAQVQEHLC